MGSTLFKNIPSKVGDIVNDVITGRILVSLIFSVLLYGEITKSGNFLTL